MRCEHCNSTQTYHRSKTNDFKCIKCGGISHETKESEAKILPDM